MTALRPAPGTAGTGAPASPTTPLTMPATSPIAAAGNGAGVGERLAKLLAATPATDAGTLVAVTVPVPALDPIALFAAAAEADIEAALWLRPSEGLALVGIGRAWAIEAAGPARFTEA